MSRFRMEESCVWHRPVPMLWTRKSDRWRLLPPAGRRTLPPRLGRGFQATASSERKCSTSTPDNRPSSTDSLLAQSAHLHFKAVRIEDVQTGFGVSLNDLQAAAFQLGFYRFLFL